VFATDEVLKLTDDKGVYFDPSVGVVLQNCLKNRDKYNGIGNDNDEGFAYGTDALPGAHGPNADEIVERVRQDGQKPMDAIISATSMVARSLRPDKTIGTPPATRTTSSGSTAIR